MTGTPIVAPTQKETSMVDAAFVERTDAAVRTSRRAFPTAGLSVVVAATVLAVGVSRGADNNGRPAVKPGVAVADEDDALLWRAATSGSYYHNRVLVLP